MTQATADLKMPGMQTPGSTPTYLTSFIGRQMELDEVGGMLRDRKTRLLTLTGSGGSGKTRLAARLADNLEAGFEDGGAKSTENFGNWTGD